MVNPIHRASEYLGYVSVTEETVHVDRNDILLVLGTDGYHRHFALVNGHIVCTTVISRGFTTELPHDPQNTSG